MDLTILNEVFLITVLFYFVLLCFFFCFFRFLHILLLLDQEIHINASYEYHRIMRMIILYGFRTFMAIF